MIDLQQIRIDGHIGYCSQILAVVKLLNGGLQKLDFGFVDGVWYSLAFQQKQAIKCNRAGSGTRLRHI